MADEDDLARVAEIAAERAYERALRHIESRRPERTVDTLIQIPPANTDEMMKIAKVAAKEAVSEVWLSMGVDPTKPLDFAKDMMFLREMRETMNAARRHGMLAFVALMVGGIVAACVSYMKATHT